MSSISNISKQLTMTAQQADKTAATGGNGASTAASAVQNDYDTILAGFDDWKAQNPGGSFKDYQTSVQAQTGKPDAYASAAWAIAAQKVGGGSGSTTGSATGTTLSTQGVSTQLATNANNADKAGAQGGNSATAGAAAVQGDVDVLNSGFDDWKQSHPGGSAKDYESEVKKLTGKPDTYANAAWSLFEDEHK